jgi:hypothetical protein
VADSGKTTARCSGARRRCPRSAPPSLRRRPGAVPPRPRLLGHRRRPGIPGMVRWRRSLLLPPSSLFSPLGSGTEEWGKSPKKMVEGQQGAHVRGVGTRSRQRKGKDAAALGDWTRGRRGDVAARRGRQKSAQRLGPAKGDNGSSGTGP